LSKVIRWDHDLLGINSYPLMAKHSANPAIAISFKFIADRGDGSDDLSDAVKAASAKQQLYCPWPLDAS
jgi:hypothetical protein